MSQASAEVSAEELRRWLAAGKEVTVLDIRPETDHETWHVPGSDNLPVYDQLQAGDTDALQGYEPGSEPVVTVCGRGAMADVATQALREHGIDARTLAGGLRAWTFAWNTADVELASGTEIVQVRRTGKGCLSYLVASQGRAIAVDPALGPDVFGQIADERGWTIEAVVETHLHADHVSRARPLAEAREATHLVPAGEPADFDHETLADGDTIRVGGAHIEAIATPGHTPGSLSYEVDGEALLTGDTLFPGAVGRPDLEAEGREAERARQLHRSLRQLTQLDDDLHVLAAHADEPLDFAGELYTARLGDLVDEIDLLGLDEEAFVDAILDRLPETPPNHETIIACNRQARQPEAELTELEAGANRCAAG